MVFRTYQPQVVQRPASTPKGRCWTPSHLNSAVTTVPKRFTHPVHINFQNENLELLYGQCNKFKWVHYDAACMCERRKRKLLTDSENTDK